MYLGCDVSISEGYAKIESPGFDVNDYPDNINCTWQVEDPQGRALTMVFDSDFHTETNRDIVTVSKHHEIYT